MLDKNNCFPKNWIEGEAIKQLQNTANFPGMEMAVGLPDLHPGKGSPIGAAFFTKNILYPHLIGNDPREAGLIKVVALLRPLITYKTWKA